MSWEKIVSSSAESASKVVTQLASEALDDFLNGEEGQGNETADFLVSSVASVSQAATASASQAMDDFLNNNEDS
jgi:hypothetical protein